MKNLLKFLSVVVSLALFSSNSLAINADLRVGPQSSSDGAVNISRSDKTGAQVTADAHGHLTEATARGTVFSNVFPLTITGISAGNLINAAAAASTQFALCNPSSSGKNLSLIRFGMGVVSGTPPAGALFHGIMTTVPTLTSTGTILSNNGGSANSVARAYNNGAGAALTGGSAPITTTIADFSSTATAQASVGMVKAIDYLDGSIVVPPGQCWLPLWAGAGTALLNSYSITWEEVPL